MSSVAGSGLFTLRLAIPDPVLRHEQGLNLRRFRHREERRFFREVWIKELLSKPAEYTGVLFNRWFTCEPTGVWSFHRAVTAL